MKVQATVLLNFQAATLEEAGALLDDVLERARQREDVDVAHVDFSTPPGDRLVTLPPVSATGGSPPHVPSGASRRNDV
jgi:hypothetical protein